MSDRKRILVTSILIMAGGMFCTVAIAITVLYRTAFEKERVHLAELAKSQAHLLEAVVRFDERSDQTGHPTGSVLTDTMTIIADTRDDYRGFGQTGELVMARREGDKIVFLYPYRHGDGSDPDPIPWRSELTEPMRRALSGQEGTTIGLDYRGERVLAAYHPVAVLNLGVVVKTDMAEIRAPFVLAALGAGGVTVLLVLVGVGLTLRVTDPLVRGLQESEERFRLTLDAVSGGGWDWNVVTGEVYYSDRWLESLGYTRDEVPPHISFWDSILHPDDLPRCTEVLNAHLGGHTADYECENRLRTASGEYRWNLDRGRVIARDGAGDPLRMVGTDTDITERKRVEEELRANELKLRAITTAAQDAIIMMDHEGLVAFWNNAAERIFGWTKEEMTGRPLHEIIVPAKYHDAHHKAFPAFQRTGEGAAIGQTLQVEARHKDGTEIPIELSLSAFQLDGSWCSIGLARDITKRVENERSQARLKAAIEATTDTVYITDTGGVILYANPALERITGYRPEEVIGVNPRIFSSGEHDKAFYQDLWGTITRGEIWRGRFVNKKKDGTIYHEEATISPIKDEKGQIINYVAVKRDVTRQRAMERRLLQAEKMESIGQLAAGIAHEINTPTQYVGDNTRFIRDSIEDLLKLADRHVALLACAKDGSVQPELIAEFESAIEELDLEFVKAEMPKAIEQTLDGMSRVAKIVGAMKDFSHPDGGKKTTTDLNRAIESTITVCCNRWKYLADLETDFENDLPMVPCLVGEFNQVILNVIVNAADAIGEFGGDEDEDKGRITVSTRQDGEWVEIRVSDTGGGIPTEIQQKIFDPFFTTKQVGKGTGQGLSICHDVIVNKHGGTIDFEVEPGMGTTFVIRLPIAEQGAMEQRGAA